MLFSSSDVIFDNDKFDEQIRWLIVQSGEEEEKEDLTFGEII